MSTVFPFIAHLELLFRVDTERLQQEIRSLRADTQRLQQENRSVNNIPYRLLSYLEPTLLQIPGRDL